MKFKSRLEHWKRNKLIFQNKTTAVIKARRRHTLIRLCIKTGHKSDLHLIDCNFAVVNKCWWPNGCLLIKQEPPGHELEWTQEAPHSPSPQKNSAFLWVCIFFQALKKQISVRWAWYILWRQNVQTLSSYMGFLSLPFDLAHLQATSVSQRGTKAQHHRVRLESSLLMEDTFIFSS